MSAMTYQDQHITEMIESHTAPLKHNLTLLKDSHVEALKRLEEVEKDNAKLKRSLVETLDLLRNHFGPAE